MLSAIAAAIIVLGLLRVAAEKRRAWRRVFDIFGAAEIGLISLLLALLVGLGGTQIVLRNTTHTGILWAEPLMRHLVLWLGCLGATLATARVRHINIDVFSRLLPPRWQGLRDGIVHTATAVATFVLGVAALRLVIDERAFGDAAFVGVKTWVLQTILPFAFFLISYRSLVNMLLRRRPRTPGDA